MRFWHLPLVFCIRDYETYDYLAVQPEHSIENTAHALKATILHEIIPDHYLLQVPRNSLDKRSLEHATKWSEHQIPYTHLYKRDLLSNVRTDLDLRDPGFDKQWHLLNLEKPGYDMNITGVWHQNITGSNVTVAFIDDGLDHTNPDLAENFSLLGSYDFNEHKKLPTPALDDDTHGTRCAGEVAAVKNNVCGVGVAYTAKVAGLRILSGKLTNSDEALAVTYACNTTQIYSCSWGPRDDGRTMEIPPEIVSRAFDVGIKKCRNGLGSIYVFAAGNGGISDDNCNFDGYTNNIYTITVAAMNRRQEHPKYSEKCSATLVTMYSSSGYAQDGIYTTDWTDHCTSRHGGTSAAAPLAAGVYALILSIRPDLNWRDLQRLTVENAVIVDVLDSDWIRNGAGRLFNHKYGYGTFDTYKVIEAAKVYKGVGTQGKVEIESTVNQNIPQNEDGLSTSISVNNGLYKLEHVEVVVSIKHGRRGDISVYLTSPSNFTSTLIEARSLDESVSGFEKWRMMTVAHWDEEYVGNWTLKVVDNVNPQSSGSLSKWTLRLWGEAGNSTLVDVKEGSGVGKVASNAAVIAIAIVFFLALGLLVVCLYRRRAAGRTFERFNDDWDEREFDDLALTERINETEILFEQP